jgi:hypothetical protein
MMMKLVRNCSTPMIIVEVRSPAVRVSGLGLGAQDHR